MDEKRYTILDDIFGLLQDYRTTHKGLHPRVLRIGYVWERALRLSLDTYLHDGGILPLTDPNRVTVFGMYIEREYTYGPWSWAEGGREP